MCKIGTYHCTPSIQDMSLVLKLKLNLILKFNLNLNL